MKKTLKTAAFLFAVMLLFSSCSPEEISEEPAENPQSEQEFLPQETEETEPEEEKLFDPETEELFEILWNSEEPSEEMTEKGYAFYGAEKCSGYENLLSFAEKYPENRDGKFFISASGTTWELYKISYSETDGNWVFAEYWIDTYRNNERREKIKNISEIKFYENRVTFVFEDGGKKVIYEKGSELGLPVNNCSHPEQAHFIDIEIIRYINSDEFRAEYEKSRSEPYMTFDEYTNLLWSEEEECLMNIYHYIERYGLEYEDFIAAYGSEERIAEVWRDADIKGYFGK